MYQQSEKNLLNSNISSRCLHIMVNFGPLTAKIGRSVWGIPANFNGFRIFASLLQWRRSLEAKQTLHDVWPSPGLVHYLYIFGALGPWWSFARFKIHFVSMSCVLLYWQHYCMAVEQPEICGMLQGMKLRNFHRGLHLYSAGRPSCLASAHILVPVLDYWKQILIFFLTTECHQMKS